MHVVILKGSESFSHSQGDCFFNSCLSHVLSEGCCNVRVNSLKPYTEPPKSNRKLIWKEVDIAGLKIISLALFPLLCSSRTK